MMLRGEEEALIRQAAAGDRRAQEALIRAHQQSLFGYLARLSGRTDVAEDIVQDAFVRALTNLQKFDPRYRFSTWLFTIARRLYLNHAARMRPVSDSEMVGAAADRGSERSGVGGGEAERREERAAARDAVQAALLELPEAQREVVVLFHQLEWGIAAIAEHTGLPEGTVKSHLFRARHRMKEFLLRSGAYTGMVPEKGVLV